jgi:hypothetical protein
LWKRDTRNLRDSYIQQGGSNLKLFGVQEKGNRKAAAIFGVDEWYVCLWWKHKAAISGDKVS